MSGLTARSSVAAVDWLPIQERLIDGLGHALSNRAAALIGVAQLFEMRLTSVVTSVEDGAKTLGEEAAKLGELVLLIRSLGSNLSERREPVRAGDAVRLAAEFLAQDREVRAHTYEVAAEPAHTPPLLLWRADHLRLGVLLLLAASDGASQATTVRIRVESALPDAVRILASTSVPLHAVRETATYAILERFAAAEGGSASSAAAPEGTTALVLSLPGLGSASAQGEPQAANAV